MKIHLPKVAEVIREELEKTETRAASVTAENIAYGIAAKLKHPNTRLWFLTLCGCESDD